LTLNSLSSVALRREFYPLKFPYPSRHLPLNKGFSLHFPFDSLRGPLCRLGEGGVSRAASIILIPKRGVEV